MPTELEEVRLNQNTIEKDNMSLTSFIARRVPSPWKHSNSTNRYDATLYSKTRSVLKTMPAAENLVGYSTEQPNLFKRNQLEPIKDLKLLIKDYGPIAKNALTMLVNLSEDEEVVKSLIEDDAFLESLLRRVTVCQ